MAMIQDRASNRSIVLRPRHIVGRSRLAQLRIQSPSISGEHAIIVWTGTSWEIRDMGSRNGTFVDDKRLESGERTRIRNGCNLRFGSGASEWQLVDASAPVPMVIEDGAVEPLLIRDGLIALPSEEEPEITVFKDAGEEWMCEVEGNSEPISSLHQIQHDNRNYTVVLPESFDYTTTGTSTMFGINDLSLRFSVSRDEEYVRLQVRQQDREVDLGARAHHYVILTLARTRIEDAGQGLSCESQGWVYFDDLAKELDMDEQHVNVAIYRCRQQLNKAGVKGAAGIVERRRLRISRGSRSGR